MIKIKVNGKWQYRWIQSGTGYNGQNSFQVEFGLGTATTVDSLVIRWPSGITQVMQNVTAGQSVQLKVSETSLTTSTNDLLSASTLLYPNPAKGQVFLKLGTNQFIREKFARIYDVNGRLTRHQIKTAGANTYAIDLRGLPPGIYWFETETKAGLVKKKIVVVD
jgi:hypothetical protein